MKVLIIDCGLVRLAASSMLSGNEPTLMPTAKQEVCRRFAKICTGLEAQHSPNAIIFAKDRGPYLRADEYKSWYKGQVFAALVEDQLYMKFDNGVRKVVVADGVRTLSRPLAKADREAVEEVAEWMTDMAPELEALAPKYKGKRKEADYAPLGFATRKEFYEAVDYAVEQTSGFLGAFVAEIGGWEADDIAGVYCQTASSKITEIVLATVDSDWQQLVSPLNPAKGWVDGRVKVHDLYHDRIVDNSQAEEIQAKTLQKVIGGDTSDNISGLPKGANGCHGKAVDLAKVDADELLKTHEGLRNKALVLLPTPWLINQKDIAGILKDGMARAPLVEDLRQVHLSDHDLAEIRKSNEARSIVNKLLGRMAKDD